MKLPGAVPEAPSEIHKIRVSSGYIASKHVSEHILERASQRTPLRPIIVRVCQLTGFENGSWGVHEWVPQIILAADVVGCLPNNTTVCTPIGLKVPSLDYLIQSLHQIKVAAWMPTVPAAIAVIQMLSSPYHYLHLAHPRPIPYSTLIRYAADIYNVPVIPYAEWLSKLEAQLPDANVDAKVAMKERPFLALLPVFRRFDENTFPDSMDVETRRAEEVAEALSEDHLPLLGREDVRRWIEYWKKTLRARSRAKL
jgi:thioester reductase-like protein